MSRPKIVITGSEGFIGKHLTRHLERDFEISRFDLSLSVFHNITQKEHVSAFLEAARPHIVIHLAANPDVAKSIESPQEDLYLNTLGTINVLEACRRQTVGLFVLASSAVVYGEAGDKPFCETDPLQPTTPYGIGKLAAEQYCNLYFKRYNIPTVIFRFFNIYGPGQTRNFAIPNMIARIREAEEELKLYGNREDARDFVYISDVCRAMELAIERCPKGKTYNVSSGREIQILTVAEMIAQLMGKKIRFFYQDHQKDTTRVSRVLGDNTLISRELGWSPKMSLDEGLAKMIDAQPAKFQIHAQSSPTLPS